jgi:DNA repair ATPase RecN
MEKCNFKNLKAALHDPQTRIRYSDNVRTHNYPKIKGLVYLGDDGFFRPFSRDAEPQVLGFADNLTCFIGGRGSGKSATIDSLRYVFKGKMEIESLRESLKEDVYGRSDHTFRNTALYILMESSDGAEVVVNTFYQGWDSRSYESCFMDGSGAGIDLSASTDYRVEIFGWSEIEDLGTDTVKQRQLLDKFIPEIHKIQEDISEIKRDLETNRNEIIKAARELEDMIPGVKDYSEAKAAFDRINTEEMKKRFEEIDAIAEKQTRLRNLEEGIGNMKETLDIDNLKIRLENIVEEMKKDLSGALESWAEETLARIFESEKEMEILHRINKLLSALSDFFDNILKTAQAEEGKLHARLEELKTQLATVEGVSVEMLTTIEKRKAYKKRYDDLKEKKENIKKKREGVGKLFNKRDELLDQFIDLQNDRSSRRNDKKDEINNELERNIRSNTSVVIDFKPLGSREDFESKLGRREEGKKKEDGILKGVGTKYMERRFAETISEHLRPKELTKIIMDGDVEGLVLEHPDGENNIDYEDAQKIVSHLSPRIELYGEKHYDSEKLQILLELEEMEYEDLPEIKLDGESIMGLSPGQRCSALVPIVLLQGDCPLIIDQPEDNLDNKLVFDLVVDILRSLKEFRQIIVATHNPNIPVSGDAEQILLFESIDRATGKVEYQGSIDNEVMISKVKEVMEGGELAFHTRAQKYRYTPSLAKR